jgi:uncharacterized membrane protein YfcA
MYSDSDLDAAVAAGAISADAAAGFRAHVTAGRAAPLVDEEHFRLVTGFNDIFVAIASTLLLTAMAWIGGDIAPALGAAAVAATAWGLAEYFTRQRRMALPSILLLLAFVGGVFGAAATTLIGSSDFSGRHDALAGLMLAASGAIAAGAAWFHWRRFKVPITVAAGAAAGVAIAFGLLGAVVPNIDGFWTPIMFLAGLTVFAGAMWWDVSDRERKTRRSDVAFWLHLLAAPLIVHPVFSILGVFANDASMLTAIVVVGLYVVLAGVALAIDRRALMVSALAYVLFALSTLFRELGAIGLNVALTSMVIGSALLLLSAFWHTARRVVVGWLPPAWQARLPATSP